MGCIGMRGGGRGKEAYGHHLIRSLLDSQPASQPARQYTILERARGRPDRPCQIRSDQTRQTDFGHAHVCFVRGQRAEWARNERLLPLSKLRCSKYARDFLRFVPLFRQDERREQAVLGPLPAPFGGAMRVVWPIVRGGGFDS